MWLFAQIKINFMLFHPQAKLQGLYCVDADFFPDPETPIQRADFRKKVSYSSSTSSETPPSTSTRKSFTKPHPHSESTATTNTITVDDDGVDDDEGMAVAEPQKDELESIELGDSLYQLPVVSHSDILSDKQLQIVSIKLQCFFG